jgi:4-alpha-glucanotransferase
MLVGEDLGTVPPEVPEAMSRHNFHRMHVIQYELKPDARAALPVPPAASLATINTHDMAPFAGFWLDCDLEERCQAGLLTADKLDDERATRSELRKSLRGYLRSKRLVSDDADAKDIFRACLAHLRDSPARIVLINSEDLWNETQSQNIPSTSGDSPNWRRKGRYSFEEFSTNSQILELLQELGKGLNYMSDDSKSTS